MFATSNTEGLSNCIEWVNYDASYTLNSSAGLITKEANLKAVVSEYEKHGFAFGVESKEGKGTVFFVDFPLVEDENA